MSNSIVSIVNNEEGLYAGDLNHYYKLVFTAPNVNNPYHNFRHMMHVFCRVYEGACYNGYYKEIGPQRFRALLIASLFHDYGHSEKMGNDVKEIATALNFLDEQLLPIDRSLWPEIKELISATEFPYNNEVAIGAKIMRDADMSQLLSDVWMQQIIFGLAQEMGISPADNLVREIDFLRSIEFCSDWGQKTFKPQIPARVAELTGLLNLLS